MKKNILFTKHQNSVLKSVKSWQLMSTLYHSSNLEGLKEIVPRKSTHGTPYVYATPFVEVATLFLTRWNDFLMTLVTTFENDHLQIKIIERYPNAFKEIFEGKKGFIYLLDDENFKVSTDWACERVSEQSEAVLESLLIEDVYQCIKDFESEGRIELYYYPNRPDDIPKDDTDMIQKAIDLYKMSGNQSNIDYCMERFPKLKEPLREALKNGALKKA